MKCNEGESELSPTHHVTAAPFSRLLFRWCCGLSFGTLLIAGSSPWFVRSYSPLVVDPIRRTWVLPSGNHYRWRSEGYATTHVGPLGMPGRVRELGVVAGKIGNGESINGNHTTGLNADTLHWALPDTVPPNAAPLRVALWGDSQVEGVCLADEQKLFAIAERLSAGAVEVFPLARSGQDAADWLTQLPMVEDHLSIDLHLFLVADLEDLLAANLAPLPPPSPQDVSAGNAAIAARYPAFVIQAARNLLTVHNGATRRTLRFRPGPIPVTAVDPHSPVKREGEWVSIQSTLSGEEEGKALPEGSLIDNDLISLWNEALSVIRRTTSKPVWVLDAPVTPEIVGGDVRLKTFADNHYVALQRVAPKHRIEVISVRKLFNDAAAQGRWPHGFQNGQIGVGHLNQNGNQLLAETLLREINVRKILAQGKTSEAHFHNDSDGSELAGFNDPQANHATVGIASPVDQSFLAGD